MNVTCPSCGGAGTLFINDSEFDCARCEGTGEVQIVVEGLDGRKNDGEKHKSGICDAK